MNVETFIIRFRDLANVTSWIQALAVIDSIYRMIEESAEDERFLEDFHNGLSVIFSEYRESFLATTIACESMSQIKDERVFGVGSHLIMENQAHENYDNYDLYDQILSSLMLVYIDLYPNTAEQSIDARLEAFTSHIFQKFMEIGHFERLRDLIREILERFKNRSIEGEADSASLFTPHFGAVQDIKPGDCVFRELNIGRVRDFGHAAMYVGHEDPSAPLRDHYIIEMKPRSNCVLSRFSVFCQASAFWGVYSADLNNRERRQLVSNAMAFVGKCRYGVGKNHYKNPVVKHFRCDGLVEHLYENLRPLPSQLRHRGGLFEDDTWYSLNPNALRNCFLTKIQGANFTP